MFAFFSYFYSFFFLLASFELIFSYFFCVLVKHIKLNSRVPLDCLLRGDTCVCIFFFLIDFSHSKVYDSIFWSCVVQFGRGV
mgnify:CR=1 FL=1